jgi:hypothetical protein
MNSSDPRYPIGEFHRRASYSVEERGQLIEQLKQIPTSLSGALAGLSEAQLDTPYREGGWTLRQVAHHISDSHLNAYLRVKLALTEDQPVIKPYDENAWVLLADTRDTPLIVSVALLEALHTRWAKVFAGLNEPDWKREYRHPVNGPVSVEATLAWYVWHGQHHVAHITGLRQLKGW